MGVPFADKMEVLFVVAIDFPLFSGPVRMVNTSAAPISRARACRNRDVSGGWVRQREKQPNHGKGLRFAQPAHCHIEWRNNSMRSWITAVLGTRMSAF